MIDMFAPLHKIQNQVGLSRRRSWLKYRIVKPPAHFSQRDKRQSGTCAEACGVPKPPARDEWL